MPVRHKDCINYWIPGSGFSTSIIYRRKILPLSFVSLYFPFVNQQPDILTTISHLLISETMCSFTSVWVPINSALIRVSHYTSARDLASPQGCQKLSDSVEPLLTVLPLSTPPASHVLTDQGLLSPFRFAWRSHCWSAGIWEVHIWSTGFWIQWNIFLLGA